MHLPVSRRWKLERMRRLLALFGHPEKSFLPVVIVGTKGKGSTGFFLQSILKEAGVSVGFYSSPHLETPRERIRLHGRLISKSLWARLLTHIRSVIASPRFSAGAAISGSEIVRQQTGVIRPDGFDRSFWRTSSSAKKQQTPRNDETAYTYFEIMTLMAALAFKDQGVKIGVFEAGMGGRLDAVNTLAAPFVIVTPVHLDHEAFLGNTLIKIAGEKAAVIHQGAEVVTAPQKPEVRRLLRTRARKMRASLWPVTRKTRLKTGLRGEHQRWNAAAAVKMVERLCGGMALGHRMQHAIRKGLAASDWPGRFESFPGRPSVILDGAHNPAAMETLVKTLGARPLRALRGQQGPGPSSRVVIFGVAQDKDSQKMLKTLAGFFDVMVLAPLPTARMRSLPELLKTAQPFFKILIPAKNVSEALTLARAAAGAQGTILVTGSFYLIGEIRKFLTHSSRRGNSRHRSVGGQA